MFTKQLAGSDDGRHLYILYSDLVAVLDTRTNDFRPFHRGQCSCIAYDEGIWIGMSGSLLYAKEGSDSLEVVRTIPEEHGHITAILCNGRDQWLGTSNGDILHFHGDVSKTAPEIYSGKISSYIYRIYEDSKGTIWAGSLDDGALSISRNGTQRLYRHDSTGEKTISSNFVRTFCEDDTGNIWIGTYTGLDCLDPVSGDIRHYNTKSARHDGLSHSSIWSIRKDHHGTLWVATYYGGVNYFNPEYNIYEIYPVSDTEGEGLSSHIISSIIEDSDGNLWIGTEGGGLNRIDCNTGRTTWYNTDKPGRGRLTENNVKDMIYVPSENAIYVGLHIGGVNRIDAASGEVRAYISNPGIKNSLPSDDVLNIADYGDSLVVRMMDHACVMDKKTGVCRPIDPIINFIRNGYHIRMFMKDDDDNIWVCSRNPRRLMRIAPPYTSAFEYTDSDIHGAICDNEISCMMQDESGKIWFATSGSGVYIYDSSNDTFTSLGGDFTLRGGHQMVKSPYSGNIIISSQDGFIIFNPVTHKASRYGRDLGFPFRNSYTQAVAVTKDSTVLIGGHGGLVHVAEKDLDISRKPYKLFFTSLKVNGEEIKTGSDMLPESILNTTSVTLPADTKSIELHFSSSDHISSRFTSLEYRLDGFDNQWNRVSGERKISYTNLPCGKYRLYLRLASDSHDDICRTASLDIRISTPWYATWIAIAAYILLLIAIAFLFMRFYISKERAEYLYSLDQAKLRFFTNISHEIRTPLTIIIAEIESIIQNHKFSPQLYRKILSIYKNSMSLRELISELMEFRKHELGQVSIKAAPRNLISFINEFYLLFYEYASGKGIKLSLINETDRLEVWYDQTQMQKVLNNILSNSIKFTPQGGSVTIRTYSTNATAVIEIEDTGCGIPQKELKKIFDRFYQVESSPDINTGTGIGLALAQGIVRMHSGTISVESSEGNGSIFRISLPLGYSHFTSEQLAGQSGEESALNKPDKISIPESTFLNDTGTMRTGHTIVIAEDNPGILDMLIEIFSPIYTVVPVTDGDAALKAVREKHPSLVLSDVLMPGMSGTQLCRHIKNDPTLCHIPVVLLTARVEVEQNLEGLQQGADDYITKPFNSTLLLSRCNNLVNSRVMLQEKYGRRQGEASSWIKATKRIDNEFLERVSDMIVKNLDNTNFDISYMHKALGLSRTSFFRRLKSLTGQTPTEFIQTIRLKKGADLLRNNPEMNINEISDIIGFNTPKYFAKCFKEHFGKSPLAWRKENANKN